MDPVYVKMQLKVTNLDHDTVDVVPVDELTDMDVIVFQSHGSDYTPRVVLKLASLEVWMPIATRTHPRLRSSDKSHEFVKYTIYQ